MLRNRMNRTKIDANVERACFAALLDEQIGDRMCTIPSLKDIENCGHDATVTMKITRSNITGSIAKVDDPVYAERNPKELQT